MFQEVLEIFSFSSQTRVTSNKHIHYILIEGVPCRFLLCLSNKYTKYLLIFISYNSYMFR